MPAQQVAIIGHPLLYDSNPSGITLGPDGALWFTEGNGNKIGRITTAGVIKEYPVPTTGSFPWGITAGPGGALWFTELGTSKIGRITTAGVITEYPDGSPKGITAGPDGALWFTADSKIGQLVFTTAVLTASPSSGVLGANFTLSGSSFTPSETIHLCANSAGCGPQHTVTADAGGSFEFSGRVGPLPYGPHSLVAVGQSSGKLGVAPFSISPRLILDPRSGTVGSTIKVSGFGFGAGREVAVFWDNPRLLLGWVIADIKGSFFQSTALTFPIPARAPAGMNIVEGQELGTGVIDKAYIRVK